MTGSSANFAPPPIPQLSVPPPAPRSLFRHQLSRPPHPYRPPPPFLNGRFSQPPPNYPPTGNHCHQQPPWNHNGNMGTEEEVTERVSRNPEMNGPKPIRFSLNPAGKKHIFNKPNNSQRGGGFGGNSRFGPPLNSIEKTEVPVPGTYNQQQSNQVDDRGKGSLQKSEVSNYGLTNGSSWASSLSSEGSGHNGGRILNAAGHTVGSSGNISVSSKASLQFNKLNDPSFTACINSDNWPASLKYVDLNRLLSGVVFNLSIYCVGAMRNRGLLLYSLVTRMLSIRRRIFFVRNWRRHTSQEISKQGIGQKNHFQCEFFSLI